MRKLEGCQNKYKTLEASEVAQPTGDCPPNAGNKDSSSSFRPHMREEGGGREGDEVGKRFPPWLECPKHTSNTVMMRYFSM